jgi:hypothetical protein
VIERNGLYPNLNRASISSHLTQTPTFSSLQPAKRSQTYQSSLGPTTTRWPQHCQHSCRPCCPYHPCHSHASSNHHLRRRYNCPSRRYNHKCSTNNHNHINLKCNNHNTTAVHRLSPEPTAALHIPIARNQDLMGRLRQQDTSHHRAHSIRLSTRPLLVSRAGLQTAHIRAARRIDEKFYLAMYRGT